MALLLPLRSVPWLHRMDPGSGDLPPFFLIAVGVVALLAPGRMEQRLAELDDLHRRGVITDAEHDAGRRAALTEQ